MRPESIKQFNDQSWRRLGITQTFERLLVQAVILNPGPISLESVQQQISGQLTGGALKFWDLSFEQMRKELVRRKVLKLQEGALSLHDEFQSTLERLIQDQKRGVSRVAPTPGVTLQEILAKAAAREERAKKKKSAKKRKKSSKRAKKSSAPKKRATPKKRSPKASKLESSEAAPMVATPRVSAPNKLFTSIKVNKLLDSLDGSTLLVSQLSTRLGLRAANLDRFLEITHEMELTRSTRGDMVELHWRGRELARTANVDRRKALIDLVRELREKAVELEQQKQKLLAEAQEASDPMKA